VRKVTAPCELAVECKVPAEVWFKTAVAAAKSVPNQLSPYFRHSSRLRGWRTALVRHGEFYLERWSLASTALQCPAEACGFRFQRDRAALQRRSRIPLEANVGLEKRPASHP
jgi:hypothetical protein